MKDLIIIVQNKIKFFQEYIAYLLIAIYVLIVLYPTFTGHGFLLNDDLFVHFLAGNNLIESLKQGVIFGNFDLYGGIDTLTSYSPLFYYLYAVFGLVFIKIIGFALTWNLFLFLIILLVAFGVFFLIRKLGFSTIEAFFAAIFSITFRASTLQDFSPSAMHVIGVGPFVACFIFVPFCLVYFYKVFNAENSKRNILLAALFLTLTFLTHLYIFLGIAIFLFLYAIFRLISDRKILILSKSCIFFAVFVLLTLFWWISYYNVNIFSSSTPEKLSSASNFKYILDFLTNNWEQKIDRKFPFLLIFGFIGIESVFFSERLKKAKIYLIGFLLSSMLYICGILDLIPIPMSSGSFAYTYIYGRGMAFIKYVWIIFGVIGAYEIVSLLTSKLKSEKNRKIILFVLLSAMLVFISTEQYRYSTNEIKDFGLFRQFELEAEENTVNQDIKNIAGLINENGLSGKIFADNTFDAAGKAIFILPVLAKNHGLIVNFPMDRMQVKARQTLYYLYDEANISLNKDFINILDDLGIDFIVTNKNDQRFQNNYEFYQKNGFASLYNNQLVLLARQSKSELIEYVDHAFILIDDEIFYKDTQRWKDFYRQSLNWNTEVILLNSKDVYKIDEIKKAVKIEKILVGKVDSCLVLEDLLIYQDETEVIIIGDYNSCQDKFNFKSSSLSEISDNNKNQEKSQSVDYKLELPNKITINDPEQNRAILVKENYFPNWSAVQSGEKLSTYFVLPANMMIISSSNEVMKINYKDDIYQYILLFGGIGIFLFLWFFKKIKLD